MIVLQDVIEAVSSSPLCEGWLVGGVVERGWSNRDADLVVANQKTAEGLPPYFDVIVHEGKPEGPNIPVAGLKQLLAFKFEFMKPAKTHNNSNEFYDINDLLKSSPQEKPPSICTYRYPTDTFIVIKLDGWTDDYKTNITGYKNTHNISDISSDKQLYCCGYGQHYGWDENNNTTIPSSPDVVVVAGVSPWMEEESNSTLVYGGQARLPTAENNVCYITYNGIDCLKREGS